MSEPLIVKLQNRIKTLEEKAYIRVGITNSITVSSSNDREEFRMPFDVVRYQGGNLTYDMDNHEIVIGANINVIAVNVQLYFYSNTDINIPKIIYIRRNQNYPDKDSAGTMNSRIGMSIKQTTIKTSTFIHVQEGDRISVGVIADENDPINSNSTMTFVEAVKIA